MPDLVGHSITYRIAVGPHRGRKVFTLQTLPICDEEDWATGGPGNVAGFSLHAGVAVKAEPGISMTRPAATPPGPASAAFRSVAHPQRTGKYACGGLGRETPRLRDLEPSRDDRAMDMPGLARQA